MGNKKRINLMKGYNIYIASMAELSDCGSSPYSHLVKIPKKELDGIDEIPCGLSYPLVKAYAISIKIEKIESGNSYLIVVDDILMAISEAYQELEDCGCLRNHALTDLWIEGLEFVDGELVLYVGS